MPTFEHPFSFLLLLCIPLLYALRRWGIFSTPSFPLTLSDWNGLPFAWKSGFVRVFRLIARVCFIAGFIASVTALASPVMIRQEKKYTSRGSEIIFVLDTSPSMAASDMNGENRLEAAKKTIRSVVSVFGGNSFGLVAMAVDAALIVPPTLDHETFLVRLDMLSPGELGDGTAIGTGISTAVYHLSESRAPQRAVIVLTDGENNSGIIHPETAVELAAKNRIAVYVVGVGTRGTVPLEYVDPVTGKVYSGYLDSAYDTAPLMQLASTGGGEFFSAENPALLLDALTHINTVRTSTQTYIMHTSEEYYYDRAALTALMLFALAWLISRVCLRVFL